MTAQSRRFAYASASSALYVLEWILDVLVQYVLEGQH